MAAVLEFLCAEILELAGNAARKERYKYTAGTDNSIEAPTSQKESYRIEPNHITSAVKNDEELHSSILNIQNTTHKQLNKREYTAAETIQQLQAAEQKKEQSKMQIELQKLQAEQQHEAQENQMDRQVKLEVAHIQAASKDTDHDNDGKTDNK